MTGLISPPLGERKEKMMAKATRWGPLAAAAGTLVAVGLLLIMVLVVVESRPAEATFPGKSGKIAYAVNAGNDWEIYTINSGGGSRAQLTNNNTDDQEPSWGSS